MLVGTYNPSLVLVSLGVAILASYTALGMANRVKASSGLPAAKFWLAGGAFAVFEARAGWCAVRAMGFRTPL